MNGQPGLMYVSSQKLLEVSQDLLSYISLIFVEMNGFVLVMSALKLN